MTDRKITLDEICEVWRHEQQETTSGHLPSSVLFDLVHQSLGDEEIRRTLRHFAACTVCLQNLKAMINIVDLALSAERPLTTADAPTDGAHRLPYADTALKV
jgi:hypothetical protein